MVRSSWFSYNYHHRHQRRHLLSRTFHGGRAIIRALNDHLATVILVFPVYRTMQMNSSSREKASFCYYL